MPTDDCRKLNFPGEPTSVIRGVGVPAGGQACSLSLSVLQLLSPRHQHGPGEQAAEKAAKAQGFALGTGNGSPWEPESIEDTDHEEGEIQKSDLFKLFINSQGHR